MAKAEDSENGGAVKITSGERQLTWSVVALALLYVLSEVGQWVFGTTYSAILNDRERLEILSERSAARERREFDRVDREIATLREQLHKVSEDLAEERGIRIGQSRQP